MITDFSDLEQIGKDHSMNINGGSIPMEEYRALDGQSIALDLIQSGAGVVTPYGVAYDNGMKLVQVYSGLSFPQYLYNAPCSPWAYPVNKPRRRLGCTCPLPGSRSTGRCGAPGSPTMTRHTSWRTTRCRPRYPGCWDAPTTPSPR